MLILVSAFDAMRHFLNPRRSAEGGFRYFLKALSKAIWGVTEYIFFETDTFLTLWADLATFEETVISSCPQMVASGKS